MSQSRYIAIALVWTLAAGALAEDPPAPAPEAQGAKQQVNVAVKIIEFQTLKSVETGLSAYFKQRNEPDPYGRVTSGNGNVTSADITFPSSTNAGITVFLDQISNSYGDFEIVLQALADENRASILSRPNAMVLVGGETIIKTTQKVPFESTVVVGATTVQTTDFRETGVSLRVKALEVIDDDGDAITTEDTYIKLNLSAEVIEEGQRITVALDDMLASATYQAMNAITVPEFVSRTIDTTVWVRHGQVLILGGLYRDTTNKSLSTLPWLTQGEDILNAAVHRFLPLAVPDVPVTTGLGNRSSEEGRRELVFMLKAKLWKPSFTISDEFGFTEEEETTQERFSPTGVISGVLEDLSGIPQGIAEGLAGEESDGGVTSKLGGDK